jgi:hypothetical protein
MQLRIETQSATVADEVSALASVMQPILRGLLYSLQGSRVDRLGGYGAITLWDLAREMRESPGDCGVCFEYAVHDALRTDNSMVVERVDEALRKHCKVKGNDLQSILFGAEKAGSQRLIETVKELLTDQSQLMNGTRGRPVKLRRHIDAAAAAFRTQGRTSSLPQSISGLWRADLFVGQTSPDRWVGTTVKSNASSLRAVRGLRLAIVPAKGNRDAIYKDDPKNLVVVPLLFDGDFMDVFYRAWWAVVYFLDADAKEPAQGVLTEPAQRQIVRLLAGHRGKPVLDVIDLLGPIAQPGLIAPHEAIAGLASPDRGGAAWRADVETGAIIVPMPQQGPMQ